MKNCIAKLVATLACKHDDSSRRLREKDLYQLLLGRSRKLCITGRIIVKLRSIEHMRLAA